MPEDVVTLHNAEGSSGQQFVMEDGTPWETSGVILASAWKRGAAYLLDIMVIQFTFAILTRGQSIILMWNISFLWTSIWYVVPLTWMGFIGINGAYFQLTGIWLGRSLGQRWFGLAVTNADATPMSSPRWGPRSWWKILYAAPIIGPLFFGLGDLWRVHRDESHQSLPDRMLGTIVVHANSLPAATRRFLR